MKAQLKCFLQMSLGSLCSWFHITQDVSQIPSKSYLQFSHKSPCFPDQLTLAVGMWFNVTNEKEARRVMKSRGQHYLGKWGPFRGGDQPAEVIRQIYRGDLILYYLYSARINLEIWGYSNCPSSSLTDQYHILIKTRQCVTP